MSAPCPSCPDGKIKTIDTRQQPGTVRRRHRCRACNHRWTTYEISREDYHLLKEWRRTKQLTVQVLRNAADFIDGQPGIAQ